MLEVVRLLRIVSPAAQAAEIEIGSHVLQQNFHRFVGLIFLSLARLNSECLPGDLNLDGGDPNRKARGARW